MKRNLLIILALIAVLFIAGWTLAKPAPQQWEYRIESSLSQEKLNKLGSEGWELITGGPTYFFKRPK